MIRILGLFLLLALSPLSAFSQNHPEEWSGYMRADYMHSLQSDVNRHNYSEVEFRAMLLDRARAELARQVKISVEEKASLKSFSESGRTSTSYESITNFSTEVEMSLVETRTVYSSATREGWAIAFVHKQAAAQYYRNELQIILNQVDSKLAIAANYAENSLKGQAKNELRSALPLFERADNAIFWMNLFCPSAEELHQTVARRGALEQRLKEQLALLEYATTIFLSCRATLEGTSHSTFGNELKGLLSEGGCNFTDDPSKADYVIRVQASSRQGNSATYAGMTSYFSYVDAAITIEKSRTGQRIYQNEISVKGGHSRGYGEAARAAYREAKKELKPIILNHIQ